MENKIPREIFYANLTVLHKKKQVVIKKVICLEGIETYDNLQQLKKYGISDPVKVLSVDIISRHGFESLPGSFTAIPKSEEKRNKIGAYE